MASQAIDFSKRFQELTSVFVGSDWLLKRLDDWCRDANASRFFLITGEDGCGKSALAAHLTRVRKPAAHHFCIAGQVGTSDPLLL